MGVLWFRGFKFLGVDFSVLDVEWLKTVSEIERNDLKVEQSWNLITMMSISWLSDIITFQEERTPVCRRMLVTSPSDKDLILFSSPVPHLITIHLFRSYSSFLHLTMSLLSLSQLYVCVHRVHICTSKGKPLKLLNTWPNFSFRTLQLNFICFRECAHWAETPFITDRHSYFLRFSFTDQSE